MRIRIVSRPIAPSWDSGSMNMAYGVGVYLGRHQHTVYMPVVQNFHPLAENVVAEPVYTSRTFGLSQKMRLMGHLLTAQPVDIMHFFLGLTRVTAAVLSWVARIRGTPAVLTLIHVPKPRALHNYHEHHNAANLGNKGWENCLQEAGFELCNTLVTGV